MNKHIFLGEIVSTIEKGRLLGYWTFVGGHSKRFVLNAFHSCAAVSGATDKAMWKEKLERVSSFVCSYVLAGVGMRLSLSMLEMGLWLSAVFYRHVPGKWATGNSWALLDALDDFGHTTCTASGGLHTRQVAREGWPTQKCRKQTILNMVAASTRLWFA